VPKFAPAAHRRAAAGANDDVKASTRSPPRSDLTSPWLDLNRAPFLVSACLFMCHDAVLYNKGGMKPVPTSARAEYR